MVIVEGSDPWEWGRDVLFPHLLSLLANIFGGLPMDGSSPMYLKTLFAPPPLNNYSNYRLKFCSVPDTIVSAKQA